MGDRSGIQWCDATWNPTRGCSRVSEGCRNCYAERQAVRLSGSGMQYEGLVRSTSDGPKWTGKVVLVDRMLRVPLQWRRPRRIFVNSMSDLFHEKLTDAAIDEVFAVMALAKQHTFMILTKRPERMREYMRGRDWSAAANRATDRFLRRLDGDLYLGGEIVPPLPNVWLGTSVENQATANERIPLLSQTEAAVRFLSCEPLLGPIDFGGIPPFRCQVTSARDGVRDYTSLDGAAFIDWVIAGGESGPGSRPMDPAWVRSLRDQCDNASREFFFKQYGDWIPEDEADAILTGSAARIPSWAGEKRQAHGRSFVRVGKTAAGNVLDGVTHEAFPQ